MVTLTIWALTYLLILVTWKIPKEKVMSMSKYTMLIISRLVQGEKCDKYVVKGARLNLYPVGFNIYKCSRGVKKPEKRVGVKTLKKWSGIAPRLIKEIMKLVIIQMSKKHTQLNCLYYSIISKGKKDSINFFTILRIVFLFFSLIYYIGTKIKYIRRKEVINEISNDIEFRGSEEKLQMIRKKRGYEVFRFEDETGSKNFLLWLISLMMCVVSILWFVVVCIVASYQSEKSNKVRLIGVYEASS